MRLSKAVGSRNCHIIITTPWHRLYYVTVQNIILSEAIPSGDVLMVAL